MTYDKANGNVLSNLDFGIFSILTLSMFENYTLICGNWIGSASANMRWGIINESNKDGYCGPSQ